MAIIEAMVTTEEEGAMEEAVAMVAMVAKEEAAIIKVGSVTDFQCCGKNLSAVVTLIPPTIYSH